MSVSRPGWRNDWHVHVILTPQKLQISSMLLAQAHSTMINVLCILTSLTWEKIPGCPALLNYKWQSWVGAWEQGCWGVLSVHCGCLPHTPAHDAHSTLPLMPHTLTLTHHPLPHTPTHPHTPLSPSHTGLSGKSPSSVAAWSGAVEVTPKLKRCLPQDQSQTGVDQLSACSFSIFSGIVSTTVTYFCFTHCD